MADTGKPTKIVLDGGTRADAERLARGQWDQASPGVNFDSLSPGVRHSAIEEAGRLIRKLADTPGVTTLPAETRKAS